MNLGIPVIDTFLSHGIYNPYDNRIFISELPVQLGSEAYLEKIKKKEYINNINDAALANKIDIELVLEPGFLQQMIISKKL